MCPICPESDRPRPIFAHVQDGARDRELRVFRGFFRDKKEKKKQQQKTNKQTNKTTLATLKCDHSPITMPASLSCISNERLKVEFSGNP